MTRIKRDEGEEGVVGTEGGWGGVRGLVISSYRNRVSKEDSCFSSMIMRNKDALLKLPGFPIRQSVLRLLFLSCRP